jgi:hypothetical protein
VTTSHGGDGDEEQTMVVVDVQGLQNWTQSTWTIILLFVHRVWNIHCSWKYIPWTVSVSLLSGDIVSD